VRIWYVIGSTTIPALLIGVVSSYFPRAQAKSAVILSAMIVSFLFSLIWVIFSIGVIEPMYPGLVSGLLVYLIGRFFKKK
jgi:Na+/pantothenate symporter